MKKKIYYAHAMIFYGSQIEHNDIKMLENMGFEVVNPNKPENEEAYNQTKDFKVFLDLVDSCDCIAFRSVMGKITSGVGMELDHAKDKEMPIIELPYLTRDRFLSWAETVEYFRPLNVKD